MGLSLFLLQLSPFLCLFVRLSLYVRYDVKCIDAMKRINETRIHYTVKLMYEGRWRRKIITVRFCTVKEKMDSNEVVPV
jgi:hypothetical protein